MNKIRALWRDLRPRDRTDRLILSGVAVLAVLAVVQAVRIVLYIAELVTRG